MTRTGPVRVWKDGRIITDPWQMLGSTGPEMPDRPTIVPLATFAEAPHRFVGGSRPLGIHVPGGGDIAPLIPHLSRLALVALEFASFADGRNYSTARLLRDKHFYEGELRAVGDVLADQIPLLRRCGINAYAISHAPTLKALQDSALAEVRHHYQPAVVAGTNNEIPAGTRPWIRRSVGEPGPAG